MRTTSLICYLICFSAFARAYFIIMATTSIKVNFEDYSGKCFKVNSAKRGSLKPYSMYYKSKSFFIVDLNSGFKTESINSLLKIKQFSGYFVLFGTDSD